MKFLFNIIYGSSSLLNKEHELKYKYIFLNTIIAFVSVVLILISIKRFIDNDLLLASIDVSFVMVLLGLLYNIKRFANKFEIFSTVAIIISFLAIIAIFIVATDESTRIIIFFIFLSASIFLKGCKIGFAYLLSSIVVIALIHFTPYIETNYSNTELMLVCSYFIIFFFMIVTFENIKTKLLNQHIEEKNEIENLKKELELNNEHLEEQVSARIIEIVALNKDVKDTQREILFTMGAIAESRSKETGLHVRRVAEYSKELALHCGIHEYDAELLRQASPMHDIGKVGIPDSILNKPGKLDADEWKIMQTHSELGYDMLKNSNKELLKIAAKVANEHHEKWDGSGYPHSLKGEDISIEGRITAIADVFDALGSDRVYKKAWDDENIFKFFEEQRAKHFDPDLVDIFLYNKKDFLVIRDKFVD